MFVKKFQMENYRCLSNYSCPKNTFKQKNDDGETVAVIKKTVKGTTLKL